MTQLQRLFGPRVYHRKDNVAYPPVEDLDPTFVSIFGPPPLMRPGPGETYLDRQAARVQYYQQYNFYDEPLGDDEPIPRQEAYIAMTKLFLEYGLGMNAIWVDKNGDNHVTLMESPDPISFPFDFAVTYVGHVIARAQIAMIKAGVVFDKVHFFVPGEFVRLNDKNKEAVLND